MVDADPNSPDVDAQDAPPQRDLKHQVRRTKVLGRGAVDAQRARQAADDDLLHAIFRGVDISHSQLRAVCLFPVTTRAL